MTQNAPVLPSPIEVDLDDFSMLQDNRFRLWLSLAGSARIALDFEVGSDEHRALLDTLTSISMERFGRLLHDGVEVDGLVAKEPDSDHWTKKH